MSTRDQILEIAYRAFAEKGYNHTSMGAIAEELGITRPALYYHFSSKEDLLLATYEMIDPLINVSADEALGARSRRVQAGLRGPHCEHHQQFAQR